jgi:hypothetical protein
MKSPNILPSLNINRTWAALLLVGSVAVTGCSHGTPGCDSGPKKHSPIALSGASDPNKILWSHVEDTVDQLDKDGQTDKEKDYISVGIAILPEETMDSNGNTTKPLTKEAAEKNVSELAKKASDVLDMPIYSDGNRTYLGEQGDSMIWIAEKDQLAFCHPVAPPYNP